MSETAQQILDAARPGSKVRPAPWRCALCRRIFVGIHPAAGTSGPVICSGCDSSPINVKLSCRDGHTYVTDAKKNAGRCWCGAAASPVPGQ